MADLLSDNTDFEVSKYYDAQEMNDAGFDPAIIKDKKSVFNPESGMNDILTSMPSGGYVKIGEEEPEVMAEAPAQPEMPGASDVAPAQAAAEYAQQLQEMQGSYTLDDLRAAGYTDEQISTAGLDVQPAMPESRTEALSEQEVADIIASGQPIITADPTLRETGSQVFTTFLYDVAVEGLKDELREQGVDAAQIDRMVEAQQGELLRNAEVYSNALFGMGATGMEVGAADFLTAGIMDIQEGRRLFNQQRPEKGGTLGGRAMGALIMAAGVAEATGVGYAFGKLLKRGAKALEPTLVRMGEEAQGRIDAEGATLFSNPVGPIVDRGLAAAGRLVAPKVNSVDDFVSLASVGQVRQARTVSQDISDITEKKMPATVINLQGADDELSIAYESGEITDQLTQAGLFVDDDQMGTIYVGTTQENLDAIKSAENPAEIGKLSGYSDADIAAFYLKRRGGNAEAAFEEYTNDLANIKTTPSPQSIGLPGRISTRLPTAKAATEDPMTGELIVGLKEMKAEPALYEFNVNITKDYPNMQTVEGESTDETAERFIEHVKDNLLYIHDKVPEETRVRSQKWYDGARAITDRWSEEYGVPDTSIAGALAALSPQKDWYQNVSLAQRVLDVAVKQRDFVFANEMEQTFRALPSLNKPKYEPMLEAIKGKSYAEIVDEDPAVQSTLRALFVRLYDQTYNKPDYQIVGPEGDMLDFATTASGARKKAAWGSLNEIGKAVASIDVNGDVNTISRLMGERHKVRNFYNNIYDPNSPFGDVTIDTHAVAAGLLRPLSGNSLEVDHNFKNMSVKGRGTTKGSAKSGVSGNYGLYAEAYRRAAAERGILPRQMQSITWEAVRGLFTDKFKQSAKNVADIDAIWQRYKDGEIDLDETRRLVDERAGGINPPSWE